MSENFYHSDKIDAYFNQAMSEGERQLFEQQVAQDPLLKTEFDLQKDIIESLKDTRRVELKSRLQNLPTPGTGVLSLPAQFIGGALIVSAVVLIGYFMWEKPNTDKGQDLIDLTAENILTIDGESVPARPSVVLIPEDKTESQEFTAQNADETSSSDNSREEAETTTARVDEQMTQSTGRNNETAEASANIELPQLLDDSDGDGNAIDNARVELPESGLDPLEEDLTENVEIEHLNTESDKRQYRFYNGKLYLYGSFGKVPYEILEINGKKGKSYYLYHNELYYKLNSNQMDIIALQEITNKRIVRELDIVRKNK